MRDEDRIIVDDAAVTLKPHCELLNLMSIYYQTYGLRFKQSMKLGAVWKRMLPRVNARLIVCHDALADSKATKELLIEWVKGMEYFYV